MDEPIFYENLEQAYRDAAASGPEPSAIMYGNLGSLRYISTRTGKAIPAHVQTFLDEHVDDSNSHGIVIDADGVRMME